MDAKRSSTQRLRPANEGVRRLLIVSLVVLAIAAVLFLAAVVLVQNSHLPSGSLHLPFTSGGPRATPPPPGPATPPSPGPSTGTSSRNGQLSIGRYPPGEPPGDVEDDSPPPSTQNAPTAPPSTTGPTAPTPPAQPTVPTQPTVPALPTLPHLPATAPTVLAALPTPLPSIPPRP